MSDTLEHLLSLIVEQREALLSGDPVGIQRAEARLTECMRQFGPTPGAASSGASPKELAELRSALDSSAMIAHRRASFASAALAAIAGSAPVYEPGGFSARQSAPGRALTA